MISPAEKKLKGTYKKHRDGAKDVSFNGEYVMSISLPDSLSKDVITIATDIIDYLCGLKLVMRQDVPTLIQAFTLLQDLQDIKVEKDKIKDVKKDFDYYEKLCKLEMKYIHLYNELLKGFLCAPATRLKALGYIQGNREEPKQTALSKII